MREIIPVFFNVLSVSLRAGIAVALVLLIRQLFLKKYSKSVGYVLWLLVFIRFLCPVTVPLPFGVPALPQGGTFLRMAQIKEGMSAAGNTAAQSSGQAGLTGGDSQKAEAADNGEQLEMHPYAQPAAQAGAALQQIRRYHPAASMGAAVWLAGMTAALTGAAAGGLRLRRRLKTSVKTSFKGYTVWESDRIAVPFAAGIFRPRIYVPCGLSEREKTFIIAHEKAHLKRKDHWIKPACYGIAALHWFNPFVWAGFSALCRDMEMSCDETVLRRAETRDRIGYSKVLFSVSAKKSGIRLPVFFGESNTKSRIKNILSGESMPPSRRRRAAVLILVVALLLFTGCEKESGPASEPADIVGAEPPEEVKADEVLAGGDDADGPESLERLWKDCREKKTIYRQELKAYEERLKQIQEELEKAVEEDKQRLLDNYNEVSEQQQAFLDEVLKLRDEESALRGQVYEQRMKDAAGKDLLKEKMAELKALPDDLTDDNAEQYGIHLIHRNEENEKARAALWELYEQTGFGKGTLPEPYEAVLLEGSTQAPDEESVHNRIIAMTVKLGTYTDEGQLIIISVTAWDGGYMILTDQARDSWNGNGGDILVNYWRYLNWLTSEDKKMEMVVASEKEQFSFEEWRNIMLSSTIDLLGDNEYHYIAGF